MATFLWGGCVSCEQYFMFPGQKAKSCCNKSGQCERPGKTPNKPETQDCNRLPMNRGGDAHAMPLPAVLPASVAAVPELQMPSDVWSRFATLGALLDPSPPDRQALHATFLI